MVVNLTLRLLPTPFSSGMIAIAIPAVAAGRGRNRITLH
jgi:hypothetical protein